VLVPRGVGPVVLVELDDRRRGRVWLPAADVRRVAGRPEAGERPEAG